MKIATKKIKCTSCGAIIPQEHEQKFMKKYFCSTNCKESSVNGFRNVLLENNIYSAAYVTLVQGIIVIVAGILFFITFILNEQPNFAISSSILYLDHILLQLTPAGVSPMFMFQDIKGGLLIFVVVFMVIGGGFYVSLFFYIKKLCSWARSGRLICSGLHLFVTLNTPVWSWYVISTIIISVIVEIYCFFILILKDCDSCFFSDYKHVIAATPEQKNRLSKIMFLPVALLVSIFLVQTYYQFA